MTKKQSIALEPEEISNLQQLYLIDDKDLNLFNLMLYTGLRASEVVDLVQTIYKEKKIKKHYTIKCKGNVSRTILFPTEKIGVFRIYEDNMFGKVMNRRSLNTRLAKWGKLINRNLTPHDMRATAITMMDWWGVSLPTICIWAGHKKVETTMKYIKRSQLKIDQATDVLINADFSDKKSFDVDLRVQNDYLKQKNRLLQQENRRLKWKIELLEKTIMKGYK